MYVTHTVAADGRLCCTSAQFETHHCVVQHTQSILTDCQPHLALLNRRGGDRLWTDQTKAHVTGVMHLPLWVFFLT